MGNEMYVVSLDHKVCGNRRGAEEAVEGQGPIIKTFPDMNDKVTGNDVLTYMLVDTGFSEDEQRIAKNVAKNLADAQGNHDLYVAVKLVDEKGMDRELRPEFAVENHPVHLDLTKAVRTLFETYQREGKDYQGLHLLVSGTNQKGGLDLKLA